jgi:hypothetical protein
MILPSKHIDLQHSLLGAGAAILRNLDHPQSVTTLWGQVQSLPEVGYYGRFILTLDFLFSIGAIDFKYRTIARHQQ